MVGQTKPRKGCEGPFAANLETSRRCEILVEKIVAPILGSALYGLTTGPHGHLGGPSRHPPASGEALLLGIAALPRPGAIAPFLTSCSALREQPLVSWRAAVDIGSQPRVVHQPPPSLAKSPSLRLKRRRGRPKSLEACFPRPSPATAPHSLHVSEFANRENLHCASMAGFKTQKLANPLK